MVTIRVLGAGCARCNELEKMCFNVLAEHNIDADMQKISDVKKIAEYGVVSTPALMQRKNSDKSYFTSLDNGE